MLSVICILCAALALWLAATLFLWHRELLEIQKALEDIGAGNLNRRIVTRGPQAIRSIGYGINKIVQQSQQSAIQQKRHEQAYKQLITNLSHDIKTPLASLTGYLEAVENGLVVGQEKEEYLQTAYERAGALRSFVEKLFEWVKLMQVNRSFKSSHWISVRFHGNMWPNGLARWKVAVFPIRLRSRKKPGWQIWIKTPTSVS